MRAVVIRERKDQLTGYFLAGVAAASARAVLPRALLSAGASSAPAGRTIVLGYGKAAAEMAAVARDHLAGPVIGTVVTRYGHGVAGSIRDINIIEAGHPAPDAQSLAAGALLLDQAKQARVGDRVIFLASGGGSALLCAPAERIAFAEKQAINRHLVLSGVPIEEINLVRRHLSRIKGGGLAAVAGARSAALLTLVISDVAGDDPALVASGPSIASDHAPEAALAILAATGWPVSPDLARALHANRKPPADPHPVDIVATNGHALRAVADQARADGWNVVELGAGLSGDAATMGRTHAAMAAHYANQPGRHLLLSGGELTVQVRAAEGRGGPNLEYLTGLMAALPPGLAVAALAGDSDGIDGSEDNAGGYFDAESRATPEQCESALQTNRSYDLFCDTGGLIITGPTRTNVNDIRMIAVGADR